MKIFELENADGQKEWFSGKTILNALVNYISTTECDISDLRDCELKELPQSEWDKYTVYNNEDFECESITFTEWMKDNPKPEIIAGTMY